MHTPLTQHLRLPFALASNGAFTTVTEDTDAEVLQNVAVILRTRVGERLATPEFGTPDPTFVGLDPTAVLQVVQQYEPRASLTIVTQAISYETTVSDPGETFGEQPYGQVRFGGRPLQLNTQAVEVTDITVRRQES